MNIEKMSEQKKSRIAKCAKKAIAAGLTAAITLSCAAGLTACDQDKDVSYSELMDMIDSDIREFNAGFDYAGFIIFCNDNKYVLSFMDDFATDNASYNITKKQFETIKEITLGLEVEEGIYQYSEDMIAIGNDILQLEQLDIVRKIIANVVQKQDPYRVEQENRTPYDDNANIEPTLQTFKQQLDETKTMYVQSLGYSELQDFDIDGINEIIIKEVQARVPYVKEELANGVYGLVLKDENDTALSDVYAIEIRDYYDDNNDGIDDRYKSIEFYDYERDATQILLYSLEEYRSKNDKNIQFKDGNWVISADIFNGGYETVDERLRLVASTMAPAYHEGSFIDAPIETSPKTAD